MLLLFPLFKKGKKTAPKASTAMGTIYVYRDIVSFTEYTLPLLLLEEIKSRSVLREDGIEYASCGGVIFVCRCRELSQVSEHCALVLQICVAAELGKPAERACAYVEKVAVGASKMLFLM